MIAHRERRETEPPADFLVRQSANQMAQNFILALGKRECAQMRVAALGSLRRCMPSRVESEPMGIWQEFTQAANAILVLTIDHSQDRDLPRAARVAVCQGLEHGLGTRNRWT